MRKIIIFILALWAVIVLASCKSDLDQWNITYPPEVAEEVNLFLDYAPKNIRVNKLTIVLKADLHNFKGEKVNGTSVPIKNKIFLDPNTDAFKYGRKRSKKIL